MEYARGASAYALSNAPILLCSSLLGSLEVSEVSIEMITECKNKTTILDLSYSMKLV